jgi:hypothetical protein
MANDEDANSAHEKCYRWQRKDLVSYVPGENTSVGRMFS